MPAGQESNHPCNLNLKRRSAFEQFSYVYHDSQTAIIHRVVLDNPYRTTLLICTRSNLKPLKLSRSSHPKRRWPSFGRWRPLMTIAYKEISTILSHAFPCDFHNVYTIFTQGNYALKCLASNHIVNSPALESNIEKLNLPRPRDTTMRQRSLLASGHSSRFPSLNCTS